MSKLRRSIVITFLAQNLATVINFFSGLVLARLLDPTDIGLYSLTAVFVGVMSTFRDFGVMSYLLREKELTPAKIRAASGLLIATSWTIAISMLLLANPVAQFYGQPPVSEVMSVLAMGFFLIPFGSVTQALLRRELEAKKLAAVTALSTITYAAACIAFAAMGLHYMSMAWANLVNIIATIVAYRTIRPDYQPSFPSFKGWRSVAKFGTGTMLSNLLTNINIAIPDTLIGKHLDAHRVGLYSRANSLVDIFSQILMPAISNNIMPVIARSHHDQQPMTKNLCKSISYLSCIAWPVAFTTVLLADDMIRVLYGEKWLECLPAIIWLCIASAIRSPFSITTTALIAIGRPYVSMLTIGSSILLKITIAIGIGANDLAIFSMAFMMAEILTLPITLRIWRVHFDIRMIDIWRALWPSALTTIFCICVSLPVNSMIIQIHGVPRLLSIGMTVLTAWLISVILTKHPFATELRIGMNSIRK